MAISSLSVWQEEFANTKPVPNNSYGLNLANCIGDLVDKKLESPGKAKNFTFNRAIFAANVMSGDIAAAFQAACAASTILPLPPATAAVIDPSSASLGAAMIKGILAGAKPVPGAKQSAIVEALYKGFKSLQVALVLPTGAAKAPLS